MKQHIVGRGQCLHRGRLAVTLTVSWLLLATGVEAEDGATLAQDLTASISASFSDEVPAELSNGDGEDAAMRERRVEKVRAALLDELESADTGLGR